MKVCIKNINIYSKVIENFTFFLYYYIKKKDDINININMYILFYNLYILFI